MSNLHRAVICLIVLLTLFGCNFITIGEPRKNLDYASTAKDQALTIKQHTTQLGPDDKRSAIEEQNNLRYKWWIDLRSDPGEAAAPLQQDEDRVKAFNQSLEKQLNERQKSAGGEKR